MSQGATGSIKRVPVSMIPIKIKISGIYEWKNEREKRETKANVRTTFLLYLIYIKMIT
jgi:hypothetical protein